MISESLNDKLNKSKLLLYVSPTPTTARPLCRRLGGRDQLHLSQYRKSQQPLGRRREAGCGEKLTLLQCSASHILAHRLPVLKYRRIERRKRESGIMFSESDEVHGDAKVPVVLGSILGRRGWKCEVVRSKQTFQSLGQG